MYKILDGLSIVSASSVLFLVVYNMTPKINVILQIIQQAGLTVSSIGFMIGVIFILQGIFKVILKGIYEKIIYNKVKRYIYPLE